MGPSEAAGNKMQKHWNAPFSPELHISSMIYWLVLRQGRWFDTHITFSVFFKPKCNILSWVLKCHLEFYHPITKLIAPVLGVQCFRKSKSHKYLMFQTSYSSIHFCHFRPLSPTFIHCHPISLFSANATNFCITKAWYYMVKVVLILKQIIFLFPELTVVGFT